MAPSTIRFSCCLFFILLSVLPVQAREWYVLPDGTGDAPTIQAAIDSASAADTVLLAAGTFAGTGNREVDFLGKALFLTSVFGPDSTTVDCQSLGRGFVFQSGETASSVLSGVTVTNGMASTTLYENPSDLSPEEIESLAPAAVFGGAVSIASGSPVVRGNVFVNCSGLIGGAVYVATGNPRIVDNQIAQCSASYGGGLFYSTAADPTIEANTIEHCTAINGGGLYCADNAAGNALGNTVSYCTASGQGGGAYCGAGSTPVFTSNLFLGNHAAVAGLNGAGGGMYCGLDSGPTIRDNNFVNNSIGSDCAGAGLVLYRSSGIIDSNVFRANTGPIPPAGNSIAGGIYCPKFEGSLENNEFDANLTGNASGLYGQTGFVRPVFRGNLFTNNARRAMEYQGPIVVEDCEFISNLDGAVDCGVDLELSNCLFKWNGNPSVYGGGVYVDLGTIKMVNCVFIGNVAATGGAALIKPGSVVQNCTMVGNGADRGAGIAVWRSGPSHAIIRNNIVAFSFRGSALFCGSSTPPEVGCNDFYGNAGGNNVCGTNTGGNIQEDPLFCDRANDDLTIAVDSPCAPANSPCGQLIGALGAACGSVPVYFGEVAAIAAAYSVEIRWNVLADEPLAGFVVYRSGVRINTGGLIPPSPAASYKDDSVRPSTAYEYRIAAVYGDGTEVSSRTVNVTTKPGRLALGQNHPNPFNPSTTIEFTLPERMSVDLNVFDVRGGLVARLISGARAAGPHSVTWNGRDRDGNAATSGVYFVKLDAEGRTLTRKILLLK